MNIVEPSAMSQSKSLLVEIKKAIVEIEKVSSYNTHLKSRCIVFRQKLTLLEKEVIELDLILTKTVSNGLDPQNEGILNKIEINLFEIESFFAKLESILASLYGEPVIRPSISKYKV